MSTTNFAKRLKEHMKKKGISQTQLALMIGKGKSSISQYLSGKNIPHKAVQAKIAEVLDCTVDDLHRQIETGGSYTHREARMIVTRRELQEYISVLPDNALKALKPLVILLMGETLIDESNLTKEQEKIILRGCSEYQRMYKSR